MHDFFAKLIIATVQGLTEFLPISSSGHIVLFAHMVRLKSDILYITVLVHAGSLLALIINFWHEILEILKNVHNKTSPYYNWLWYIIIATIPAGLVGFIFADKFARIFESLIITGLAFVITGIILIMTKFVKNPCKKLNIYATLTVGIAQIFAIVPGISRSGITISSGLFSGLDKDTAYKFGFILGIPTILGACILELPKCSLRYEGILVFLLSLITSILAIRIVRKTVLSESFYKFSYYCFGVGILTRILAKF